MCYTNGSQSFSARKKPVPYQRCAPAWSTSSSTESIDSSWRSNSSSSSGRFRRSSSRSRSFSRSISRSRSRSSSDSPSQRQEHYRYRSRSYSSSESSSLFSVSSRSTVFDRSPSVLSCYSVSSTSSHHSSTIYRQRSVQT